MKTYPLRSMRSMMIVLYLSAPMITVYFLVNPSESVGASAERRGGRVFLVNSTSDTATPDACAMGGQTCTLRGAILEANSDPEADTIQITLPAWDQGCSNGVCTINLGQALPTISTPMTITGWRADRLIIRRNVESLFTIFTLTNGVAATFSGLTISNGSQPGGGGGIRNVGGTVNLIDCIVSGNLAPFGGAGGGIYNSGTMSISGSTISGNQAPNGNSGGIRNEGTLNVVNSTISGNSSFSGGAISQSGTLNISHSTIAGNSASNFGGGIHNSGANPIVTVKNTIIAGNNAPQGSDLFGSFVSAGFNLIGKTDGGTGFNAPTDLTGTVASPMDPMLGPLQVNGGRTMTLALLTASPAIDKGTSTGLNGELTTDQRGFLRTFDNPAVTNAVGGNGTDIGAYERGKMGPFDFDGDGKTDVSIFRPSNGQWWFLRSSDNSNYALQFGLSTDKIVPADYTGDGITDVAIYRPSEGAWYILRSEDFSFYAFPFGISTDLPAPADFDGDNFADPAVFRPSTGTWYILRSSGGVQITQFGGPTSRPIPADFDGDGKADIAVFTGTWWVQRSSDGQTSVTHSPYGANGDYSGDYTGDGKVDVATFSGHTNKWHIWPSEYPGSIYSITFGTSTDIFVPGDYDGDSIYDLAYFRPSDNSWNIKLSTGGTVQYTFGAGNDVPVPNGARP